MADRTHATVDGRAAAPSTSRAPVSEPLYEYVAENGQRRQVTGAELAGLRAEATTRLRGKLRRAKDHAENHRSTHEWFIKDVHGKVESLGDAFSIKAAIGIAVDWRAGVVPPPISMWGHAIHLARDGEAALAAGNLAEAARLLTRADSAYQDSVRQWNAYMDAIQEGGKKLIDDLEVVRDVSFAIAITAAVIVAAPVVAGVVGGTGVVATVGTALGTGAVGAGFGAGLRGGAEALGQKVVNGKVDRGKVWHEAKTGAKEGLVSGLTAGTATGLGSATGVGAKGLSLGQQLGRRVVVEGTANAVGSAAHTALEGGKAKDVLKAGAVGFGTGAVTAPLGVAGGRLAAAGRGKAAKAAAKALEIGGAATVAGGMALAEGKSWREAGGAAARAAATTGPLALGTHPAPGKPAKSGTPETPATPATTKPATPETPATPATTEPPTTKPATTEPPAAATEPPAAKPAAATEPATEPATTATAATEPATTTPATEQPATPAAAATEPVTPTTTEPATTTPAAATEPPTNTAPPAATTKPATKPTATEPATTATTTTPTTEPPAATTTATTTTTTARTAATTATGGPPRTTTRAPRAGTEPGTTAATIEPPAAGTTPPTTKPPTTRPPTTEPASATHESGPEPAGPKPIEAEPAARPPSTEPPTTEPGAPRPAATEPSTAAKPAAEPAAAKPATEPPAATPSTTEFEGPPTKAVAKQRAVVAERQRVLDGAIDGIDRAGTAVTKAQKRLAAEQAKVATAKDPAKAQERVAAAKKELDRTSDWLQRDILRAEARGKDLNRSTRHLERIEARAGKSTEAPRQDMKAPFDPKNRRPDLGDVKNVPKDLKAARPGDVAPDARVRVHHAEVRSDLQAQHDALIAQSRKPGSDNKALGHVYERLLVDDLTPGAKKGFRMESDAGDKTRVSDHGVHEITLEGEMSAGKLDQIWRDLLAVTPGDNKARNTAIVTVPTLSSTSERQLIKMAHAYEQLTGNRPTIIVRETAVP